MYPPLYLLLTCTCYYCLLQILTRTLILFPHGGGVDGVCCPDDQSADPITPSLHYLLLHQAALIRAHQLVSANWNQSRQGVTTRAAHQPLRCFTIKEKAALTFKNLLKDTVLGVSINQLIVS